jgi:hypothetical protein
MEMRRPLRVHYRCLPCFRLRGAGGLSIQKDSGLLKELVATAR